MSISLSLFLNSVRVGLTSESVFHVLHLSSHDESMSTLKYVTAALSAAVEVDNAALAVALASPSALASNVAETPLSDAEKVRVETEL